MNLADLPPSQVDRLVAEIDSDENGVIDLDEFDQILMGETSVESDSEVDSEDSEDAEDVTTTSDDSEDESDEQVEVESVVETEDEESVEDDGGSNEVEVDTEEAEETAEEEQVHDADDEEGSTIEDEDFDLEDELMNQRNKKRPKHLNQAKYTGSAFCLADLMDEHDLSLNAL